MLNPLKSFLSVSFWLNDWLIDRLIDYWLADWKQIEFLSITIPTFFFAKSRVKFIIAESRRNWQTLLEKFLFKRPFLILLSRAFRAPVHTSRYHLNLDWTPFVSWLNIICIMTEYRLYHVIEYQLFIEYLDWLSIVFCDINCILIKYHLYPDWLSFISWLNINGILVKYRCILWLNTICIVIELYLDRLLSLLWLNIGCILWYRLYLDRISFASRLNIMTICINESSVTSLADVS